MYVCVCSFCWMMNMCMNLCNYGIILVTFLWLWFKKKSRTESNLGEKGTCSSLKLQVSSSPLQGNQGRNVKQLLTSQPQSRAARHGYTYAYSRVQLDSSAFPPFGNPAWKMLAPTVGCLTPPDTPKIRPAGPPRCVPYSTQVMLDYVTLTLKN